MIDACTKCGIQMMFAGYEEEPQIIYENCKNRKDIEWNGYFDFNSMVAKMYSKCDVIYCVYDANMENVKVALPNKLYESVYCELPIIVAKGTYLEQVVNEWGVGVAVDHQSSDELEIVLLKLKDDPKYYEGFVKNCKEHKQYINVDYYNEKLSDCIYGWAQNEKN